MPKAKPFSDEDEKTTIEADSQWEDEPSTTVEQGEVQEKMRALGLDAPPPPRRNPQVITNVTSTNGSALDESTVDDQQNPMAPVMVPARLVITGGNDAGLETDINSGKAYTIGRGLDNDIVLTDIAVSRKHFDLRNEGGSWVIVDRGSGNGTVVNGNLEDNPFMLANGDVIEIGNTTFRFDFQAVIDVPLPKEANAFAPDDDDEMSTVAGKPLNRDMLESVDVELETGSPMIAGPRPTQTRPKTLPPPVPLRPRTMSQAPAYPSTQPQGTPGPMPSTTLPMPQMANRPPAMAMASPHSPTLLAADPLGLANMLATTIPGQGVQPPMHMHGHNAMAQTMIPGAMQAMYGGGYPQAAEIPPHSLHAQMLVVQGQNSRGDHSTAHVPPLSPYSGGMVAVPPARFSAVQPLSTRAKYVIVLGAVTVFATIATVAIIKSHGSAKTHVATPAGKGSAVVTPLAPPKQPFVAPPPKLDPPKVVVATPPTPPKQDPPKQDPPKQDPPKQDPPKIVVATPPKQDPPKVVVATPPKQDPPKVVVATPPKQDPPKQDPPKVTHQANNNSRNDVRTTKPSPPKQDPPPRQDPPKHVATADPSDRANSLYQDKKFTEAGNVFLAAAKTAEPEDAATYKTKGQKMLALAHAFNNGMAQATKPADAFDNLVQANNFDSQLGGHFEGDITDRLKIVAPKAAMSFVGSKNYDKAHTAVQKAEQLGVGSDSNVKLVKQKLESEAAAIYAQAVRDFDSNPSAAKEKWRQVKSMLDSKSPTYQKAVTKLLGG